MGKTFEKVRMWSVWNEDKIRRKEILPLEVEAQIDNGASTAAVLTAEIVAKLKLPVTREVWVKYANEKREKKKVVAGLRMEIMGRDITCDAILEEERKMPLVGRFALEILDLWIDSKNGRLVPNPKSPDTPLLEEL